jgi:hypothetical protein
MKLVFAEALYVKGIHIPVDVGVVVCDADNDYEIMGYMGEVIVEDYLKPDADLLAERYPAVAQVMGLIKPPTLQEANKSVMGFVDSYMEDDEYILVSRTDRADFATDFKDLLAHASAFLELHCVETMFDAFGVECEHSHDDERYREIGHRAVRAAAHNHAEFIVYRNNVIGWAQDLAV